MSWVMNAVRHSHWFSSSFSFKMYFSEGSENNLRKNNLALVSHLSVDPTPTFSS